MRKTIQLSISYVILFFSHLLFAQTSVIITSPDVPASDGPSTPVRIVAQASTTNSSDCVTFTWVNVTDGGNLGAGQVTGKQSTLIFTPSSSDIGSQVDVQVQVTDTNDNTTAQYDINIIVPQLIPRACFQNQKV